MEKIIKKITGKQNKNIIKYSNLTNVPYNRRKIKNKKKIRNKFLSEGI